MKKMFCLEESAGGDNFQKWYRDIFSKHQDDEDKAQVIVTYIKKYYIFED